MSETRTRTWLLAIAPVALAVGYGARPYVNNFAENEVMAAAIAENAGRWATAALLIIAAGVVLVFALPAAVRRAGGSEGSARWVHTVIIIGTVAFGLQGGLVGLGAAAASSSGADVAAFLDAAPLEVPILVVGLLALLAAWIGVIRAVWVSGLPASIKWVVIFGGALSALGHWYPASIGEYIATAGSAVALWPLAFSPPAEEARK